MACNDMGCEDLSLSATPRAALVDPTRTSKKRSVDSVDASSSKIAFYFFGNK